jgi:hypothetical protein
MQMLVLFRAGRAYLGEDTHGRGAGLNTWRRIEVP